MTFEQIIESPVKVDSHTRYGVYVRYVQGACRDAATTYLSYIYCDIHGLLITIIHCSWNEKALLRS